MKPTCLFLGLERIAGVAVVIVGSWRSRDARSGDLREREMCIATSPHIATCG